MLTFKFLSISKCHFANNAKKKRNAVPGLEPLFPYTNLPRNVIMCKFFLLTKNRCKNVLPKCDSGKVVVVFAVNAFFAVEAVLLGVH